MPDDPRVRQMIEEILDSGSSVDEVCHASPELLPQVRDGLRKFRAIEARIGELFPESRSAEDYGTTPPDALLPDVPGYDLVEVLGRGGVGVVYRAVHRRLHRTVALKMLLAGAFASRAERQRFSREAEVVASLRHPNVVQIYDVGDHDGRPYLTMEFVAGGSMTEMIAGTPRPARQAAELVATLADAIEAAHRGGIVHRDLKPSNVLLAADGTPKVCDFGLARHLGIGSSLTQSGAAVGTPSYMAPEQAQGKADAAGPAADIYSLGAVLYEMLTGRPPFRAETASETVQQVILQAPVPPSRLNGKVPRDLETICLKCLRKEPRLRYATAAALADDLRRFREGRPIWARRLSLVARLWRWGRRNPLAMAAGAMTLVLVMLAISGGLWLQRQEASRRAETARSEGRAWQAVEATLERAMALQEQGRWPEARVALEGAPGLLTASSPTSLRERVRQARADADIVAELEEIRLRMSDSTDRRKAAALSPERMYGEAFRRYGIDLMMLEPAEASARIRDSAIRQTLLAYLHDWLYWMSDANRERARAVVDASDDSEWRRAFRAAHAAKDSRKLKELGTSPEAAAQPPVVLSGLGGTLLADEHREEALALLSEAQRRHPGDFWINYLLGHFWDQERPQVAVGYFRVAVSIRPSSDQAYTMLGKALRGAGDTDGAIVAFRQVLALNSDLSIAITEADLAKLVTITKEDLGKLLAPRGGLAEVRVAWENLLRRNPSDQKSWYGYAPLCLFLGDEDAYRRARRALLDRFGDVTDDWRVAERTSLACLLLPASGLELRRAAELAGRAVDVGPKHPHPDEGYVLFVKGLAEFRQGRPERAIPLLQESAAKLPGRAGPRLVLAMAQFRSGSPQEARRTLAATIQAFDWSLSKADHTTMWVSHVLRREAEAMILPDLPAFLEGK